MIQPTFSLFDTPDHLRFRAYGLPEVSIFLIDESADVSFTEQMAVVFRSVDKSGIVKKRFINIIHVSETYFATLKFVIDSLFAK